MILPPAVILPPLFAGVKGVEVSLEVRDNIAGHA